MSSVTGPSLVMKNIGSSESLSNTSSSGSKSGEFFFAEAVHLSEVERWLRNNCPCRVQVNTPLAIRIAGVLFLKQQVVDDAFQLDVEQGVAVGDFDRLHRQLMSSARSWTTRFRCSSSSTPRLRCVLPRINLYDSTTGATHPRNVFRNFRQHGSEAKAGFARAVAEQRWLGPADGKIPHQVDDMRLSKQVLCWCL